MFTRAGERRMQGGAIYLVFLAWMYYEMIYRHPDADNNQEAFEGLWLRFERRVRALEISTLYADE